MSLDSYADQADKAWGGDDPSVDHTRIFTLCESNPDEVMNVVLDVLDKERPEVVSLLSFSTRVRSLDNWLSLLGDEAVVSMVSDYLIEIGMPYMVSRLKCQSKIWLDLCTDGVAQSRLKGRLIAIDSADSVRILLSLTFDEYVELLNGSDEIMNKVEYLMARYGGNRVSCVKPHSLTPLDGGKSEGALVANDRMVQSREKVPGVVIDILLEHRPDFFDLWSISQGLNLQDAWCRMLQTPGCMDAVISVLENLRGAEVIRLTDGIIDVIKDNLFIAGHMYSDEVPDESMFFFCNGFVVTSWTLDEYKSVLRGENHLLLIEAMRSRR